jgi:hypothetical protein
MLVLEQPVRVFVPVTEYAVVETGAKDVLLVTAGDQVYV